MTNDTTAPDRADGDSAFPGTATVSVVICVYDAARWDSIRRVVASLGVQTHPVDEVIVVVDHNPDLFARVAGEIEGVVAIENGNDRGLSGARNSGAAVAHGEFVAFLDDDAAAAPDWVERLVAACDGDSVLGAGGRSLPRWLERKPSWFPEEFLWVVGCTYRGLPEQTARVRNIYGGCFAIRRDALAELSGFRSEFGRVGCQAHECRGDRAVHPRRETMARPLLRVRAGGHDRPRRPRPALDLVVLPEKVLRRRDLEGASHPACRHGGGAEIRAFARGQDAAGRGRAGARARAPAR